MLMPPRSELVRLSVSFGAVYFQFGTCGLRILKNSWFSHSLLEERWVLLGISKGQRLLAVMYIERSGAVRIISARRATPPERRDYEEIRQVKQWPLIECMLTRFFRGMT
jgi:uncharacterized DUF497 family protein